MLSIQTSTFQSLPLSDLSTTTTGDHAADKNHPLLNKLDKSDAFRSAKIKIACTRCSKRACMHVLCVHHYIPSWKLHTHMTYVLAHIQREPIRIQMKNGQMQHWIIPHLDAWSIFCILILPKILWNFSCVRKMAMKLSLFFWVLGCVAKMIRWIYTTHMQVSDHDMTICVHIIISTYTMYVYRHC